MYKSLSPNITSRKKLKELTVNTDRSLNKISSRIISPFTIRDFVTRSSKGLNTARTIEPSSTILKQSLSSHFDSVCKTEELTSDNLIKLYKSKCKDLDISYLNSQALRFLSFCNTAFKNRAISLQGSEIGEESSKILSKILKPTSCYCKLNLANNHIGDAGLAKIAKLLKNNKNFIHIDISSNEISPEGSKQLFASLLKNESIISINISSKERTHKNRVSAQGSQALSTLLYKNSVLTFIDLASTCIGTQGIEHITHGLSHNTSLLYLNLSDNQIDSKCMLKFCLSLAQSKIKDLILSQNNLGNKSCEYLANVLMSKYKGGCNLTNLEISKCEVTEKGAKMIFFAIDNNSTLKTLDFSYNNINGSGSFIGNSLQHNSTLCVLNLAGCNLKDEGISQVSEGLYKNISVERLSISNNLLTTAGIKSFAKALELNKTIKLFDLSCNYIKNPDALLLISSLKKNHTVQAIVLNQNSLKDEIGHDLIEFTRSCENILKLELDSNPLNLKFIYLINKNLAKNEAKIKESVSPRILKEIEKHAISDGDIQEIFSKIETTVKEKQDLQRKISKKQTKLDITKIEEIEKFECMKNEKIDLHKYKKRLNKESEATLEDIMNIRITKEKEIRERKEKISNIESEIITSNEKCKLYSVKRLKESIKKKRTSFSIVMAKLKQELAESEVSQQLAAQQHESLIFTLQEFTIKISELKSTFTAKPLTSESRPKPRRRSKKKTLKKS